MTKVLDCTLRDGGYYNSWDFSSDIVNKYLAAVAQAGVDMVELGLRNFPEAGFHGPFYYSTEGFISNLSLSSGPEYGVMLDAKTVLNSSGTITEAVNKLFVPKHLSELSFVRLACHYSEVEHSHGIVNALLQLGYKVFVNLMQISIRSDDEISALVQLVNDWDDVEGVYFADSLGNMMPEDVERIIGILNANLACPLGIHAHNNMGLAVTNALKAYGLGVQYLDSTISGMGRGAGNAETEILIAELQAMEVGEYSVSPLANILENTFKPMKQECGWGPSLHYHMAARYNIHPTYVQRLLTDSHFGADERIGAVANLSKLKNKTSFNEEDLTELVTASSEKEFVEYNNFSRLADLQLNGSDAAILIGSGQQALNRASAIRSFVDQGEYSVFALNLGFDKIGSIIDFYVISSGFRSVDLRAIKPGMKILGPCQRFTHDELKVLGTADFTHFGLHVEPKQLTIGNEECSIPYDLTAGYALSSIVALGFKKVFLVGFDGYRDDDARQKEMSEIFHIIQMQHPEIEIIALTPSTYPVKQGSLYAPSI